MRRLVIAVAIVLAILALAGAAALASGRGPAAPPPPTNDARQKVEAPIDDVSVLIRESNPPQVSLKVKAGLPSGCAQRDSHTVSRSGDTITVRVLNTMPVGNPICTMIYGSYELTIDLGSSFTAGTTYIVHVNDKTTTFKP